MAILFHEPRFRPLSATGGIYAGGKLYSYQTGTTTLQNTYNNSDLAVGHENANPIIADSAGLFGPIYMDDSLPAYKFVFKDSNDVTQWTIDPYDVEFSQSALGSILYPITAAEIAASVTPTNYFYPAYTLLRYGADPTGVSDSTTAFNNAFL